MNAHLSHLRHLLAAGLFAVSLHAADSSTSASVEGRLQRLEEEVTSLRAQNQELLRRLNHPATSATAAPAEKPAAASLTVAAPAAVAVKPSGKEQSLSLGGFLQLQADFLDKGDARFTSDNDRIYLRRARIGIAGRFNQEFDFKMDVEMAGSLSETTGYRAQLMDGYINWTRHPQTSVRIGQFKTPYGYEQLASDTALPVIERSLSNDRLTLGRQIGAQVSGDFLGKRLSYATGIFNGTSTNNNTNDNDSFLGVARIAGTPLKVKLASEDLTWTVGTNAFSTKDAGVTGLNDFGFANNTFSGQREGFGFDTQLRRGAFELWGEYLHTRFRPTNNLPADSFSAEGWNAQLLYNVVPKYWQSVFRFESFDPNRAISGNSTDAGIIGANYLFGRDDFKLMLGYYLFNAATQPDHRQKVIVRLQTLF